jgi:hypothetical protein
MSASASRRDTPIVASARGVSRLLMTLRAIPGVRGANSPLHVSLSGADGDDAKKYEEKNVGRAIENARKTKLLSSALRGRCVPRPESDSGVCQACRDSREIADRIVLHRSPNGFHSGSADFRSQIADLGWVWLEPTTNPESQEAFGAARIKLDLWVDEESGAFRSPVSGSSCASIVALGSELVQLYRVPRWRQFPSARPIVGLCECHRYDARKVVSLG